MASAVCGVKSLSRAGKVDPVRERETFRTVSLVREGAGPENSNENHPGYPAHAGPPGYGYPGYPGQPGYPGPPGYGYPGYSEQPAYPGSPSYGYQSRPLYSPYSDSGYGYPVAGYPGDRSPEEWSGSEYVVEPSS
jgi:hypothetical protein